jgi:hypothetical protein
MLKFGHFFFDLMIPLVGSVPIGTVCWTHVIALAIFHLPVPLEIGVN